MKMNMLKALFFVAFFGTTSAFAVSIVNIQNLNQTLQKKNAGWIAKDNWLTHLSKPELKRMMGLKDVPATDVDFVAPKKMTLNQVTFPSTLDWRNKDGKNWISPILNQGNCGSCVAFAAIGVMESQLNISNVLPNLNVRLSAQNLFACGGGACDQGWYPSSAARFLMNKGVTDEACMPYVSGATGEDVACNASCADSSRRTFKIADYNSATISMSDSEAVKRALQHGPVVTTLNVYADFIAYAGGVYKHSTGEYLGGHAISIIGYDDSLQAYIIRNSWGEDWGEQGFGHVAYTDASGVGSSTWGFDIPTGAGAVSLMSPRDYSYITGSSDLTSASTYANTDSVAYAVYDKNNASVWSSSCQGASCSVKFDSSALPDGRYEVQTTAMNAHGQALGTSSRQFFYVANQKPVMSLSFKGEGQTNLQKPVSDRIVLEVSAQSSTVPMSSLEFHFKDASGKETTRKVQVVLNKMTMGWRTNFVPNGNYEVWMVGRLTSNSMNESVETPHVTVTVQN